MPTVGQNRIRKAVLLAALVLVLAAGAISLTAIRCARQCELHNLCTLRILIDNYTYDQGKEPRTYQDLVDKRYLRKIRLGPRPLCPESVENKPAYQHSYRVNRSRFGPPDG